MGRIQSTVGLVTGLPIQETVAQLLAVSARPRDLLVSRNKGLQQQQVAVTELTAKVLGVQFAADKLGSSSVFRTKTATSSNPSQLSASVTGEPAAGSYQFTPVRQAQTHQLLSTGFTSRDEPIGEGAFSFRFGGFVDDSRELAELNGGAGVQRGKIRITDRSGESAIVDLRFAKTVDDVLEAINTADGISVTAATQGDSIKITDNSGAVDENLQIDEVSGGATAADLGLAGVDVAANEAIGEDVLSLFDQIDIDRLNDGSGVQLQEALADLVVTFRDESELEIDFLALENEAEGIDAGAEKTLGDLIDTINAADPARLRAEINESGDGIKLIDLTDGAGEFSVSSAFGGSVAEDLRLTGAAVDGEITGGRLQGGLKSPLLSSLGGGVGLGELGLLELTDRAGQSATVDLSSAETLDEVVAAINDANVDIAASINTARNGLLLEDTSGGAGALIVASGADSLETAESLQIAVDDEVSSVDSGSLRLATVSENTRLDDLFGGQGLSRGQFLVTATDSLAKSFDLRKSSYETVGDLIDAINDADIGVLASINSAGDGIALQDTAGGEGDLDVRDLAGGASAAQLGLTGEVQTIDIDGEPTQVIEGSTAFTVEISAEDTLDDLIEKINALDVGVSASVFTDGSGVTPHRLSLSSQISGEAGELLIDTASAGFQFTEISQARDALLVVGAVDSGGGILTSSSSNTFTEVLQGVSLSVGGASAETTTIKIAASDSSLVSAVQSFVDQYNALRETLDKATFFDETSQEAGVLLGANEALRVDTELANLVSGRIAGAGDIKSLAEVGVDVRDDGKLSFDAAKLKAKFAANPEGVEEFFTAETTGVSARFHNLIESLAGEGSSLLVSRAQALQQKIEVNNERIQSHNERLELEQQRLLTQFYNLETTIGKLQNNLSALDGIQPLPPL